MSEFDGRSRIDDGIEPCYCETCPNHVRRSLSVIESSIVPTKEVKSLETKELLDKFEHLRRVNEGKSLVRLKSGIDKANGYTSLPTPLINAGTAQKEKEEIPHVNIKGHIAFFEAEISREGRILSLDRRFTHKLPNFNAGIGKRKKSDEPCDCKRAKDAADRRL